MTQAVQSRPTEPLVISRHEDGYRVFRSSNPQEIFFVSGGLAAPTCTCGASGRNGHCEHVLAVLGRIGRNAQDPGGTEEHRAIQEEYAEQPDQSVQHSAARMLLKRSVSPDGRINSLSVEFSSPVSGLPTQEITVRARQALALQAVIVEGFLGNVDGSPSPPPVRPMQSPPNDGANGDTPIQATLLAVGGLDTRWGRRLFINVQVNGKVLKLFGSPKQLSKALASAGYHQHGEYLDEGMELNLPCRVTIKPKGNYLNVDKVFPPAQGEPRWSDDR